MLISPEVRPETRRYWKRPAMHSVITMVLIFLMVWYFWFAVAFVILICGLALSAFFLDRLDKRKKRQQRTSRSTPALKVRD